MDNYFLIYMKSSKQANGYKKWPVLLYKYEDETYKLLKSLKEISEWLSANKKICFLNYRNQSDYGTLLKSQILTIIGYISISPTEALAIQDVYTLNEAAKGGAGGWEYDSQSTGEREIQQRRSQKIGIYLAGFTFGDDASVWTAK